MSEIVFNSSTPQANLESQVESLQTTLASLNQRVYVLQESVQEKDQEIAELTNRLVQQSEGAPVAGSDNTLTIVGALINLYKFIFLSGKAE